jgi:hypothetical protein
MKSLTLLTRSNRTKVALSALALLALVFACQGNSPSVDTTASAPTHGSASSETLEPEATTVPTATVAPTSAPPSSGQNPQATSVEVKPNTVVTSDKPSHAQGALSASPKDQSASPKEQTPPSATAAQGGTEAPSPSIEKPCLAKSFEFSAVKSACEKGGVPKAKALMKGWTKKAKDKGEEYKCTTCHDNQRTYTNKPNATSELRKLLDVIK